MENERNARLKAIEDSRRLLGRLVQSFERDFGINSYFNRAPKLRPAQLANAVVLVDRYALLDLLPKNGAVIEVGVDKGDFSLHILKTAKPRSLKLIDLDLSRLRPENEKHLREIPSVELIEEDSSATLANLEKRSFDWIYIDAHHGYDYVRRDIISSFDKVKVGGYLVFNDYTHWSPTGMMNYGVSRAVNEFLNANSNWIVSYLALHGGGYHDIALRNISS